MFSLNCCPVCNQQIEFFGLAHHKQESFKRDDFGEFVRDDKGNPIHEVIIRKWSSCSTCGGYFEYDYDTARLLSARTKGFTKDELDRWFPAARDFENKKKSRAAA